MLAIVVLGKSLAAFVIVVALRRSRERWDMNRRGRAGADRASFHSSVTTAAQGLGMHQMRAQVIVAVALLLDHSEPSPLRAHP